MSVTWKRAGGVLVALVTLAAVWGVLGRALFSERGAGPGKPAAGVARLAIEQPVIDFGPVAYDQRVDPTWALTNVGSGPLLIKDLQLKVEAG
jgi:hypothetical protein